MLLGTFGQESEWLLGVPSTYQYPKVLTDILCDSDNSDISDWSSLNANIFQDDSKTLTSAELEVQEHELDISEVGCRNIRNLFLKVT